ncbi:MAG: hypothetical protein ACLTKG_05635 [Collinsella intestinalis]
MLSISRRNLITLGASFCRRSAGRLWRRQGCPGSTGASGKTGSGYKVGVLQLVEHGALDQTNKGFVAALDESVSPTRSISKTHRTISRPARPSRASS